MLHLWVEPCPPESGTLVLPTLASFLNAPSAPAISTGSMCIHAALNRPVIGRMISICVSPSGPAFPPAPRRNRPRKSGTVGPMSARSTG